jgi:hypothetical protein
MEDVLELSKLSKNLSTGDLLARRLSDEGRTSESSRGSSNVDLIHQSLIERNIYPHGPPGIGKQRNGKQYCAPLDGCSDIPIAQDIVYGASRRYVPPCAFKSFRMLTKSGCCIGDCLFQGIACRKASFNVWKPDAEGAVWFFFNDGDVLCRHRHDVLLSRPPAGQLVNPAHESGGQISSRVGHGDDDFPRRVFERVMISVNSIENPSILLQHRDQLAAVSFHRPLQSITRSDLPRLRAFDQAGLIPRLPARGGCPGHDHCVNIYTLFRSARS